jgi:DNA-directed RNA polymerase specialized sigma24 family protein
VSLVDIRDVAQTVWLRLVEHPRDSRNPRALPSWLVCTTKSEVLRWVMLSSRLQLTDPRDEAWDARVDSEDDLDADLVRSERHAELLAWSATLSPRQRQLLTTLAEDPPITHAEVSRRTEVPIGVIGPNGTRALARPSSSRDPCREHLRNTLGRSDGTSDSGFRRLRQALVRSGDGSTGGPAHARLRRRDWRFRPRRLPRW